MREWTGSNPEKRKAGSGAGLILVVLVTAVSVSYLASGALRGSLAALLWREDGMLTCDGGQKMTLQGREVTINDPVLDVGGLCELHVVDCTLTSNGAAMQVGGDARVVVENSRLVGRRAALFVRGNAEVTLLNVELVGAQSGIDAGNNARVEMRGGVVRGEQAAVAAYNSAEVRGVGAEAVGPLRVEQQSRVADFVQEEPAPDPGPAEAAGVPEAGGGAAPGAAADPAEAAVAEDTDAVAPPEAAAAAEEDAARAAAPPGDPWSQPVEPPPAGETDEQKYRRYAADACGGVLACYQEHEFIGHVAGKISMKVDAAGKVRTIRSKLPGASRPIGRCIKRVCKRKRIADFDGPPGTLVCSFAGTLGGGSVMISRSGEFVPRKQRRRGRRSRRSR